MFNTLAFDLFMVVAVAVSVVCAVAYAVDARNARRSLAAISTDWFNFQRQLNSRLADANEHSDYLCSQIDALHSDLAHYQQYSEVLAAESDWYRRITDDTAVHLATYYGDTFMREQIPDHVAALIGRIRMGLGPDIVFSPFYDDGVEFVDDDCDDPWCCGYLSHNSDELI